jgi:hypothetical protein
VIVKRTNTIIANPNVKMISMIRIDVMSGTINGGMNAIRLR